MHPITQLDRILKTAVTLRTIFHDPPEDGFVCSIETYVTTKTEPLAADQIEQHPGVGLETARREISLGIPDAYSKNYYFDVVKVKVFPMEALQIASS